MREKREKREKRHTHTHTHTPPPPPPPPPHNTHAQHHMHTHTTPTNHQHNTTCTYTHHTTACTHITHNTPHNTHHTPHQTTDCDLESVFDKRKVNARICAPQATDRDLETKKVNASIRANASFIYNCNACNACNVCIFLRSRIVFDLLSSCNACNLMQPYCFRFYFRFVTVFILAQMVSVDPGSCAAWYFQKPK